MKHCNGWIFAASLNNPHIDTFHYELLRRKEHFQPTLNPNPFYFLRCDTIAQLSLSRSIEIELFTNRESVIKITMGDFLFGGMEFTFHCRPVLFLYFVFYLLARLLFFNLSLSLSLDRLLSLPPCLQLSVSRPLFHSTRNKLPLFYVSLLFSPLHLLSTEYFEIKCQSMKI